MNEHWRQYSPWYILAFLVLVFLAPVMFYDQQYYYQDFIRYYYGQKKICADFYQRGELLLWNPYTNCGAPAVADISVAAFDPFNVLFAVFPYHLGLKLFIGCYLFVAVAGMYALLRQWRMNSLSALVGAICFGFAGTRMSSLCNMIYFTSTAWVPMIVAAFHVASCRRSPGWLAVTAMLCHFQLLAGDPQAWLATLVLLAVYHFAIDDSPVWIRSLMRAVFYLGSLSCVVVCLSAIQLLPTWELLQHCNRRAGLGYLDASMWSLTPLQSLQLFCPALQGYPTQQWFGHIGNEMDFPFYTSVFMGSWPLFLVGSSLWLRGDRLKRFALLVASVSLLLALGFYCPLFYWCWQYVPYFNLFRYPAKYMSFFSFAFSILAAWQFQRLFFSWAEIWISSRRRLLAGIAVPGIAYVGVVVFVLLPNSLQNLLANEIACQSADLPLALSPSAVTHALAYAGIFFVLTTAWLVLARTARGRIWLAGAMLVTMGWQAVEHGWRLNPTCPAANYVEKGWGERQLAEREVGLGRYYTSLDSPLQISHDPAPSIKADFANFADITGLCKGTKAGSSGLYGLQSYVAYSFRRWDMFDEIYDLQQKFYFAGVRYLLLHTSEYRHALAAYPVLASHRQWLLCGNDQWVDKVWFPRRVWLTADWTAAVQENRTLSQLHLTDTACIESGETANLEYAADARATVRVTHYSPNHIMIETDSDRPRWLVLNDTFYPGWRCKIDGVATEICAANLVFRAICVPAGRRQVRFDYAPRSFSFGAAVSAVTWLILLTLLAIEWYKAKRHLTKVPGR